SELLEFGVQAAKTPAELAARVDGYCTSVADPPALREVALGREGLLAGARSGQLFVDFSTVSAELSRELDSEFAKKGVDFVQASGFCSPYYDFKGQALLRRDFDTAFSIDLMFKDLCLFLESAGKFRVPTPLTAASREAYQLARAQGKGRQDITAVITAIEDLV